MVPCGSCGAGNRAEGLARRVPRLSRSLEDHEKGRHDEFCDFHEDVDPLNFGFRPDLTRCRLG